MDQTQKKPQLEIKDPLSGRIAGLLFAAIMRVIYFTSRKHFLHRDRLESLLADGESVILVSWHNRNALAVYSYLSAKGRKSKPIRPLISASRDGSIASWAMRTYGVTCIRGSSSRGGFQAMKQLIKALKNGANIAMTPDGPRGPRYQIRGGGSVTVAKATGAVLLPVTYQAKRYKSLNSWDRMMVPYPFNRLKFVYGQPIRVPRDCPAHELGEYTQRLQAEMMSICETAAKFD